MILNSVNFAYLCGKKPVLAPACRGQAFVECDSEILTRNFDACDLEFHTEADYMHTEYRVTKFILLLSLIVIPACSKGKQAPPRIVPVAEAMVALVLVDMMMRGGFINPSTIG